MGGFKARVAVTGLEDARRIMDRVRNLGENPEPLLAIAGSLLEASTLRRFDEGKGPGGIPWPPSRRVQKHGGKTLVDTGGLEGSITHVVRENEVEVGVDALSESSRHAAALQFGSHEQTVVVGHGRTITQAFGIPITPREINVRPHGRVTNLPARPFIGVDDDDRRDLNEAWLDHLRSLFHAV